MPLTGAVGWRERRWGDGHSGSGGQRPEARRWPTCESRLLGSVNADISSDAIDHVGRGWSTPCLRQSYLKQRRQKSDESCERRPRSGELRLTRPVGSRMIVGGAYNPEVAGSGRSGAPCSALQRRAARRRRPPRSHRAPSRTPRCCRHWWAKRSPRYTHTASHTAFRWPRRPRTGLSPCSPTHYPSTSSCESGSL